MEISGDSMEPVLRRGDLIVVQPGVPVREGDRVVVRTRAGEVMAKQLGPRKGQELQLISANPAYQPRPLRTDEIDWIARIVWVSQ